VSAEVANRVYGVVVDGDGRIDTAATAARRSAVRAERAAWAPAASGTGEAGQVRPNGAGRRAVHARIDRVDADDGPVLVCADCGTVLAAGGGDYRHGLLVHDSPVSELPLAETPNRFLDDDMVFRQFCCPGCHVLVVTEVVRADDPPLQEMVLTHDLTGAT
jgi:N-methylhydantoinase B